MWANVIVHEFSACVKKLPQMFCTNVLQKSYSEMSERSVYHDNFCTHHNVLFVN